MLQTLNIGSSRQDKDEIVAAIQARMEEFIRALCGEPNRQLSSKDEWRFGTNGSLAVALNLSKRGCWFDHEFGHGGGPIDLVSHKLGLTPGAAWDWVRDWLGHTSQQPKFKSFAQQLINASQPITGTIAETYLRKRGITAQLPDCLRYLPPLDGQYASLIALATDDKNITHALCRIFLTADREKAPIKPNKKTYALMPKWAHRATVRLPGNPPLILAEGVETALSIWQSTGNETWAVLGVANFSAAPIIGHPTVIIAADGDHPESSARKTVLDAALRIHNKGAQVRLTHIPIEKDFNDILREAGAEVVRNAIEAAVSFVTDVDPDDWYDELLLSSQSIIKPIVANAIIALRQCPVWKNVLAYDLFSNQVVIVKPAPWYAEKEKLPQPWQDQDDIQLAAWLQHHGIHVKPNVAGEAVEIAARDQSIHPLQGYLQQLRWDKQLRLDRWLIRYLGAPNTDYARLIGTKWLVSAVARALQPGCKADCMLILEGSQGIRKSTALKILAGDWFSDRISDFSGKDAALELSGIWIFEIAELDAVSRAEVSTIKAFISRTHDRFRPPYGRRVIQLPRSCVFAGTINPEGGYLKDSTCARRFWPVSCGMIDIEALKRDPNQLWAEAVVRFKAGESWWLDKDQEYLLAQPEQQQRYQADAWQELIQNYLQFETQSAQNSFVEWKDYPSQRFEPLMDVTISEIFEHAIGLDKSRWSQTEQNRIARCLTALGFERYRANRNGQRQWRYRKSHFTNKES